MSKFSKCVLPILVALVMTLGLTACLQRNVVPGPGVVIQAVGNRPLVPNLAYYEVTATADTWAILVDLSDNTNYPHALTNRIILKSLRTAGSLSDAVHWRYNVGVVTAVTTATTDIEWIHGSPIFRNMFFDYSWRLPEHGLSLLVTGASLENVATFEITTTAAITSSTEISTTVGVTGTVGVGDLILFMDEISDTATFDLNMSVGYDVE